MLRKCEMWKFEKCEKCNLFSYFQYDFRIFQSNADVLKLLSDRIGRTFNRSGAFQTVAPGRFKAFNKVYDAGLQHNLKSYRVSGFMFGLILSFLSNIQLWVVLDGNSLQECSVNAGISHVSILSPTLFLIYITAIYADVHSTLSVSRLLIYGNN